MMASLVETGKLSDDEFIDVENDSDFENVSKNVVEKTIVPMEKFDEKSIDSKSGSLQTDRKSITSSHNNKTTSHSPNMNKKEDLCEILFGVMNKIFSARVVLTRLPNPVVKEKEPAAERPNTRNKDKRIFEKKSTRDKNRKKFIVKETAFINEGNTYVRKCPKCEMPPFVRKTKFCLDCEIDLIYECQKCHKHFKKYNLALAHIDSKCFIKGYYHCPVCDYKSIFPSKVKSHVERNHPSVKYDKETLKWTDAKMIKKHKCSLCAKEFDNHENLNMHIPLCNKAQEMIKVKDSNEKVRINKDFQKMIVRFCAKCDTDVKVYGGGVSSLQPCQKCESTMKFKCSRCDKQYDQYCSVSYHAKLCGELPETTRKRHPRYSIKKTIDCPHCKQPFVQKVWLKKHLLKCKVLHSKPRESHHHRHLKASCKNCDEVQNMPDRRKICAQCKSNLRFRCKICDKSFNADNWCKHLKTYFDSVKYECNDCGIGIISRKALLNHLKICKSEYLYCDSCDFASKMRCTIYRHILMRHPVL